MPGGEKRAFKVELKALSFWCSQLHLQDQFGLPVVGLFENL